MYFSVSLEFPEAPLGNKYELSDNVNGFERLSLVDVLILRFALTVCMSLNLKLGLHVSELLIPIFTVASATGASFEDSGHCTDISYSALRPPLPSDIYH